MSEQVNVPDDRQYLRPQQVTELTSEADAIDKRLGSGQLFGADRGDMVRRRRKIQRMLDTQQAPELSPAQRDAFAKEEQELRAQWTRGMCSGEEMRRNPPGAVDKNLRWHRKNAKRIARWKNIVRALHRGDESPNIANIEQYRPHHTAHDLSMEGAQIPGTNYDFPSEAFKQNYEKTFGQKQPEPQSNKVAARCGEMLDPRGKGGHERFCKACQEIIAAESA